MGIQCGAWSRQNLYFWTADVAGHDIRLPYSLNTDADRGVCADVTLQVMQGPRQCGGRGDGAYKCSVHAVSTASTDMHAPSNFYCVICTWVELQSAHKIRGQVSTSCYTLAAVSPLGARSVAVDSEGPAIAGERGTPVNIRRPEEGRIVATGICCRSRKHV